MKMNPYYISSCLSRHTPFSHLFLLYPKITASYSFFFLFFVHVIVCFLCMKIVFSLYSFFKRKIVIRYGFFSFFYHSSIVFPNSVFLNNFQSLKFHINGAIKSKHGSAIEGIHSLAICKSISADIFTSLILQFYCYHLCLMIFIARVQSLLHMVLNN